MCCVIVNTIISAVFQLYRRFFKYISVTRIISAVFKYIDLPTHNDKIRAPNHRRLLFYLAAAARMIGGFASSFEAKNASMSAAPSPSHSGRADSAFTLPNRAAFPARICLLRLVFDHYGRRQELLLLSLLQLHLYLNLQLLRWNLIIL